jgi:CheY-like chemotaxis protein
MPIMDGFTATRNIRRIERERSAARSTSDPKSPAYIVALTGLASDRDEDEAHAAGVNKFITKPVQFTKLTRLLKQQEQKTFSSGQRELS